MKTDLYMSKETYICEDMSKETYICEERHTHKSNNVGYRRELGVGSSR